MTLNTVFEKQTCTRCGGLVAGDHTPIRKGMTDEERAERIAAALAYQSTLTKTGTPRKRG